MATAAFGVIALVVLGSALGLVLKRNAIHGALFLVVNLGGIAALYLMLGAEFLAAAQVIVYAGAIMVLFVFAIMVLIPGKEETGPDPRRRYRIVAIPLGAALLAELALIAARRGGTPSGPGTPGGVETIGRLLFTDYLFPFELTSVLLLAAMVGVMLLSRRTPSAVASDPAEPHPAHDRPPTADADRAEPHSSAVDAGQTEPHPAHGRPPTVDAVLRRTS